MSLKINFLGDSITQGAGASCVENNYVSLVGKMLGCTARNYGEGGTRIARQFTAMEWETPNRAYVIRCDEMDADADLVFVFGGTNDYGHGDAELGDIDGTDEHTFCGALNSLIKKLSARYGKEKLHFILPIHRYDEDNACGEAGCKKKPVASLSTYVALIKEILAKYEIPTLSFEEEFPIPTTNDGSDGLTIDGLHPNDKGYRILAEKICEYIRSINK